MATNFDPRYDPAFQPGYEGPAPAATKSSGVQPISVVEPVETRRESRPVVERVSAVVSPPVVEPVETLPADRSLLSVAATAAPLIETRGNPWLIALWIVAAVFVIGGVAAQFAAQSLFQGNYVVSAINYYVIPSVMLSLSPWFTLAGLFAGVAAVVLNAIRWRPEQE